MTKNNLESPTLNGTKNTCYKMKNNLFNQYWYHDKKSDLNMKLRCKQIWNLTLLSFGITVAFTGYIYKICHLW